MILRNLILVLSIGVLSGCATPNGDSGVYSCKAEYYELEADPTNIDKQRALEDCCAGGGYYFDQAHCYGRE